jgi:orotidine-5'-phosphate decarboxylase
MQPAKIVPKDRLIVALDLPGVAAADAMIARLGDSVNFYKIGYQLAYSGGLPLTRELVNVGKKVFVDLKLHDIGNTSRARRQASRPWRNLPTVHAYPRP